MVYKYEFIDLLTIKYDHLYNKKILVCMSLYCVFFIIEKTTLVTIQNL